MLYVSHGSLYSIVTTEIQKMKNPIKCKFWVQNLICAKDCQIEGFIIKQIKEEEMYCESWKAYLTK